jgi:trimethylamine:corrinoid methyltransferase-like protein
MERLFHSECRIRASRRSRRGSPVFVNNMPRYEILSEDALATLDRGWRRIVSELGIEFMKPEAVELFRQHGQKVEGV